MDNNSLALKRHINAIVDLRNRLGDALPHNYDTDFNLLRWIINAEKLSGIKGNVDLAEKQIRNHFRYRKAMKLDEPGSVPPLAENPMIKDRLIPNGSFSLMENSNKFLWWTDYKSLDMVGVMKTKKSSDMLLYHFWMYEEFLKMVNQREMATGQMSGINCVIDMNNYDFNPFAILFCNNGQMTHYIQVFHYEHYPQLAYPIWSINIPKWLYIAYRMVKMVLPKDINDRIRISDHNFKPTLRQDMNPKELPKSLGGEMDDDHLRTEPARRLSPDEYHVYSDKDPGHHECLHLQINARRRKFVPYDCHEKGAVIDYYFTSDAELIFGVFFDDSAYNDGLTPGQQQNGSTAGKPNKSPKYPASDIDTDRLQMIRPNFCIGAKYVPESGSFVCEKPGTFYFVFCNKNSWLTRRNVYLKISSSSTDSSNEITKNLICRTFSSN